MMLRGTLTAVLSILLAGVAWGELLPPVALDVGTDQADYLIWEPDLTPLSGAAIQNALANNGKTSEFVVGALGDYNLLDFEGLFVCVGIYSNNYTILTTDPEGPQIEDYVANGGNCYLEGGDVWYFDPLYMGGWDFGPTWGIYATSDGSSDLYTVAGVTNTLIPGVMGMTFGYVGENNWIDHIEAVAPAEVIFENSDYVYPIGVAHQSLGGGATIGTSFEFGGLAGDVDALMGCFVDFFAGGAPDTAWCKVLDVWTDAGTYLPGDDVILTVEWQYFDTGLWGPPQNFKVGGGLGKEPAGHPRFIQNTMVGPVQPGTYTTDFVFTIPMATPLGTWAGGGGHIWRVDDPESRHIYIEHNLFEVAEPPTGEWLFWDDGTFENGLSATGPGYTSATGLNPATFPCVVESIKCYISSYNNWNNPGDMWILDDLAGYPNNVLGGPYTVQASAPDTWVQVAVNVPVTQARFYVGLECTEAIAYGPYVGADTNVPCNIDHQYWGTVSPPVWDLLYIYGSPFDCFDISYRAWVSYADGRGEWLSPSMD
jgi:hypothetical protein